MENNRNSNKKERNNELPAREKIINIAINQSREELTRGQLELKFLQGYLEQMKDEKNTSVTTDSGYYMTPEIIEHNINTLIYANQYHLARMQYYKALKQESLDKKSMKTYQKWPDKLAVDGDGKIISAE